MEGEGGREREGERGRDGGGASGEGGREGEKTVGNTMGSVSESESERQGG